MKNLLSYGFVLIIAVLKRSDSENNSSAVNNEKSYWNKNTQHTVWVRNNPYLRARTQIKAEELWEKYSNMKIRVGVCEQTVKHIEFQLAQQLLRTEWCENVTRSRDHTIELQDTFIDKLRLEIKNLIKLNTQLKEKLAEYKVKLKESQSSSCIGKLTDIYEIKVPGIESFPVLCDSSLAGSGWTVIQRRQDGSVNFNRNWDNYRHGFGDMHGEFFIGLEKLHILTKSQTHELYIYLEDFENEQRYARYSQFMIGGEETGFKLISLGSYSGDAGDAMKWQRNMRFTTSDSDNDNNMNNCASKWKSGWWFDDCFVTNLNGLFTTNAVNLSEPGIKWNTWHYKSLKFVQMMIRPIMN
ncbi:fibrinogen-like protein 1 isoform X1 [Drosophila novamexicana]|uniref:fibrinogen-like protein 1 isoform X1 n=2 Tax=Drosophila novamexicana TaxID=47314 RepID=UPI0011E5D357|nr:fibrinogen-like protein 1 isoform X1 [Drosophila novamexicana]